MTQCNCKDELLKLLEQYNGRRGALIPVLQKAQEIFGYLSQEVMCSISQGLDIPLSRVYGVATFYSQFHLQPRGRHIIRVCQGTACHVRGADKVMESLEKQLEIAPGQTSEDQQFTLESVACIGACGLAPVIMVDDDTHGRIAAKTVPKLLEQYQ